MHIGLLSSFDDPLLGYLSRDLSALGIRAEAVFLDSIRWSPKDHDIHAERTNGRLPWMSPWNFEADKIPFYLVKDHRSQITIDLIRQLKIDLLVNAGTPRILKKPVLNSVPYGVLNCHPGLLPKFRGCTCVEWALYLQEPIGNTVHFMDEGIDTGPILEADPVPLSIGDSYVDIRVKVYLHGVKLLARSIRNLCDKPIVPSTLPSQDEGRYFSVIDAEKMLVVQKRLSEGGYYPPGVLR